MSNQDPSRPGNNWFFYWKISAALWESRILQCPSHEVIVLPVFWGFHADPSGKWDFSDGHPEKNLKRLVNLLTQHGRRFCWLIPVTPAPFLPNGGVPITAARNLSMSEVGIHLASFDGEGTLHKIFSFFDSKVFPSFHAFLRAFGSFVGEFDIKAPLWGADFCFIEEGKITSYFDDGSLAFEQGLSRYLKKNHPEGVDLSRPEEEEKIKLAFTSEFKGLFQSAAQEALSFCWKGTQSMVLLGGSPKDTIERSLSSGKSQTSFFQDLFGAFVQDQGTHLVLLSSGEKKNLLPSLVQEHFGYDDFLHRFQYEVRAGELGDEFRPYGLVDIFLNHSRSVFEHSGLLAYLKERFPWMYQIHPELNFATSWIETNQHKVKFFQGKGLDRTTFGQMLKLFMMGQKVILDKTGLHPDLEKRLQIFFLENDLKIQTVNYITTTSICELGEGRFISFEGDKLNAHAEQRKFWENLFRFLKLHHPELKAEEDVFSLWRIRAASAHELNYLDVRRVNLYNPTSYKKRVTLHTLKQFAFMKMVDPDRAQTRSTPEGVEIELLPEGRVALDFGHYEERL